MCTGHISTENIPGSILPKYLGSESKYKSLAMALSLCERGMVRYSSVVVWCESVRSVPNKTLAAWEDMLLTSCHTRSALVLLMHSPPASRVDYTATYRTILAIMGYHTYNDVCILSTRSAQHIDSELEPTNGLGESRFLLLYARDGLPPPGVDACSLASRGCVYLARRIGDASFFM